MVAWPRCFPPSVASSSATDLSRVFSVQKSVNFSQPEPLLAPCPRPQSRYSNCSVLLWISLRWSLPALAILRRLIRSARRSLGTY